MQEVKVIFSLNVLPAPVQPKPLQVLLPDGSIAAPDPVVNALPDAQVGKPVSIQLGLKGGTAPFDTEVLPGASFPDGLSFDPGTGLLSGTPTSPTVAGSPATFELDVTDSSPADSGS